MEAEHGVDTNRAVAPWLAAIRRPRSSGAEVFAMRVNGIVLCGAANTGPLKDADPAPNEALIPIAGRPMVQYVIDGLRQSKRVGRILLVEPPGMVQPHVRGEGLEFVPSGQDIIDNVLAAFARLPDHEKVLICSSDIPLINGQTVDGLLDLCAPREADLYYPVVERSVADRFYPGVKRTYVHLREGVYTGGNIFLVNPEIAPRIAETMRKFLANRKNPLKMAGLLGWTFVIRLLLRILSLRELEQHISRVWAIRGAVIICPYPEVGIDVDKPSDLQLARSALSSVSS